MQGFSERFRFDPAFAMCLGIERERFLALPNGTLVPRAAEVLSLLRGDAFGYELSACQLEDRVGPHELCDLRASLEDNGAQIQAALKQLGLIECWNPVGPANMPLDVYPDPRYLRISESMPRGVLAAACRVIGTHIHVGMPNREAAIHAYNRLVELFNELVRLGDLSNGARQKLYRVNAPNFVPPRYRDWADFVQDAAMNGFVNDPRSNWRGIRISTHGTVEVRVFDATGDTRRILGWAELLHAECARVV